MIRAWFDRPERCGLGGIKEGVLMRVRRGGGGRFMGAGEFRGFWDYRRGRGKREGKGERGLLEQLGPWVVLLFRCSSSLCLELGGNQMERGSEDAGGEKDSCSKKFRRKNKNLCSPPPTHPKWEPKTQTKISKVPQI